MKKRVGVVAYAYSGAGALDYFPCRYGASRLMFRGPRRSLGGRYVAVLGSTETYGKFVARPYPALLEAATGIETVNLGCINAGIDAYLGEADVLEVARGARARIIQVIGAHNLSNRFYAVHPRRNDRFLRPRTPLLRLFPEVDFTEFSFTRHLLLGLLRRFPDRFEMVASELRRCWIARMSELLERTGGGAILLWISERALPDPGGPICMHSDPLLIDRSMIDPLRPLLRDLVEVRVPTAFMGPHGMAFAPLDLTAAAALPAPPAHRQICAALAPLLSGDGVT